MHFNDFNLKSVSSLQKKGPTYSTEPKNVELDQKLFFEVKKHKLLSNYLDEVQNIKDEYILDQFLIKYKSNLNWDDFLSELLLKYNHDIIYNKVKNKIKSMLTVSYSQIFQIKQLYDGKYIRTIVNNIPKQYSYVVSPTFLAFCYGHPDGINCLYDIKCTLNNYFKIPLNDIYAMALKIEHYVINALRVPFMLSERQIIPINDESLLNEAKNTIYIEFKNITDEFIISDINPNTKIFSPTIIDD